MHAVDRECNLAGCTASLGRQLDSCIVLEKYPGSLGQTGAAGIVKREGGQR